VMPVGLVGDERISLEDGFESLAGASSLVSDFGEIFEVTADLAFVPGEQDRLEVPARPPAPWWYPGSRPSPRGGAPRSSRSRALARGLLYMMSIGETVATLGDVVSSKRFSHSSNQTTETEGHKPRWLMRLHHPTMGRASHLWLGDLPWPCGRADPSSTSAGRDPASC